jgi:hypothetical protein
MLEQPLVMEMTFGLLSKLSRLLVETDALLVKQAEEWSLSIAGRLIKKFKDLARLNFISFLISVVLDHVIGLLTH